MYPRWLWPTFAAPGVIWLILLFLVPFYAVVGVAFGSVDPILGFAVPAWNPINWNVGWVSQVLSELAPGGIYWDVARAHDRVRGDLAGRLRADRLPGRLLHRPPRRPDEDPAPDPADPAVLDQLPDADAGLGQPAGAGRLRQPVPDLGARAEHARTASSTASRRPSSGRWSTATSPTSSCPLYASLDRIDRSYLEAARDLGASPFRTFLHVTLPLSKTGLLGGAVLIALPMFGDYYTPNIVSGAPTTSMIGNQIDLYFHGGPQPTIGAAITIILSAFLLILMGYYLWTIHKATKELRSV